MKKIVGFDVDGVLADFIWGFTAKGKEMFGSPVTHTNQQKAWDHFEGLNNDQIGMIWQHIKASGNFWRLLEPCVPHYVFDQIAYLAENEDVYFITNRPGHQAKRQTEGWLRDHGIVHPTVILSGEKGVACNAIKATHYIDDKAGNAVFAKYENKTTAVYLLDRPYNQFDQSVVGTKVRRAATVESFLKEVIDGGG